MASFEVSFLGSGTSIGVPVIGCDCSVCRSPNPANVRWRPSLLVRSAATTVVIDTGPEFRLQVLRAGVRNLDAVIITHQHSDHLAGIDDVRRFCQQRGGPLDCWATKETADVLRRMFPYIFDRDEYIPGLPALTMREIDGPFEIGDLTFRAFPLDHVVVENVALRISPRGRSSPAVGYALDCKRIPEATVEALRGADLLILDMLRRRQHPTHLTLDEALEAAGRIGAKRTLFSHISHEIGHEEVSRILPDGIALAYDTLSVAL
ncbi:MAG: MBL fold metallo-hydrolase [Planctomycetota bacterium]|nr:MBL fold metallo-hydrolase [Planctomycetota bacterium]